MPVNMTAPVKGFWPRPCCTLLFLWAVLLLAAWPGQAAAGPALAAVPPVGDALTGDRPAAPGRTGLRVELQKSAPMEGTIRVGGAASFTGRIFVGDREAGSDAYVCRWRSDGGARFLEPEGPATNTAIFLRPGRQRIWLEAVPKSGPGTGLAALSEPVELDVASPVFNLSVSPPAPLVGDEVTVTIRDFPVHDGVEFRWDPLPAKAKLVQVGERSLTFYATETGSTPVRVTAALAGADLGSATVAVAAKPYAVAVENKGLAEPPAVVWRDGGGPVPADGVAVGQKVLLRAMVSPTPSHPPLAFAWELCPSARSQGGEGGREIWAAREETGSCPTAVTVRDGRGIVLGRGEGAFAVTVSQQELDAAAANARETARLTDEAGRLWEAGEAARARETAGRAVVLNPKSEPALAAKERIAREADRLDGFLARAGKALAGDDFDEAAAMLAEARKVNPKAAVIPALQRRARERQEVLARIETFLNKARDKWDAGEVEAGLALAGQALALDANHAKARAERERMVAGRDRLIAALKEAAKFLADKRFESAASALGQAKAVNARFAAIAEMEQAIASRKARAWRMDERLARARDQWNAGDVDGALGTLTEAMSLDPEHSGAGAARKALAASRENLARAEDRAEAALGRGKLDEARAALSEAGRINPRHARLAELTAAVSGRERRDARLAALSAEAAKRFGAGDLDGAVLALDDMLALAPNDADLAARRDRLARMRNAAVESLHRAQDFLAGRRFDLALAALDEAAKSNARLPGLAAWREKVLAERGQAEGAAEERLAEAEARLDKKDFAAARQALEAAQKTGSLPERLEKKAREARRRIEAGLAQGEAARREQAARDASANKAADAARQAKCEALGREASDKRAAGDHAGAIRGYQSLLQLCPDVCQAYNNVGTSLFSLGYAAESLPWFEEAVKCAPGERLFRDNAALTREKLAAGKARLAGEAAGICQAAFGAAESRRNAGDLAGAVTGYRTVVARCPDFCAAYNNMGLSLHKLGRTGDALPWFEQALRCDPKETLFKDNYDLMAKRLRTAERGR